MPRTSSLRICFVLVILGLLLSPAVSALPSHDRPNDSSIDQASSFMGHLQALWQGLVSRLFTTPSSIPALKDDPDSGSGSSWVYNPYCGCMQQVPSDGGGGVTTTPDG